jgi:hypothetical protein
MPLRPLLRRTPFSLAIASALIASLVALASLRASAANQDPQPAPQISTPRFADPRAVVDAFRQIYAYEQTGDRAKLQLAAETLAVGGVGAARQEAAERLATRLARVFDHVAVLDPSAMELVQDDPDHAHWSIPAETDPSLVITLGFERGGDGSWRFDRRTVASIDAWYAQTEELPRIAAASGHPRSTTELVRSFVPRNLKGRGFLLEPWQWIGLLCLFLAAFFAERLITLFVRPMVRRLSQFEGVQLAPELLAKFERPFGWLLLAWLFLGGVQVLDLPTGVYSVLRFAIGLFQTVMTVWAAYALVSIVCWPLQVRADRTENKFDDMLVPLLRRTLKILVVLVGVVYIVSRLTGDIWHVLAGLSIGSLAVGFAAKDSIENLFGTFTVLMDGPFKIGDVVKVGTSRARSKRWASARRASARPRQPDHGAQLALHLEPRRQPRLAPRAPHPPDLRPDLRHAARIGRSLLRRRARARAPTSAHAQRRLSHLAVGDERELARHRADLRRRGLRPRDVPARAPPPVPRRDPPRQAPRRLVRLPDHHGLARQTRGPRARRRPARQRASRPARPRRSQTPRRPVSRPIQGETAARALRPQRPGRDRLVNG